MRRLRQLLLQEWPGDGVLMSPISWRFSLPLPSPSADYAVAIYYDALTKGSFECFLGPDVSRHEGEGHGGGG